MQFHTFLLYLITWSLVALSPGPAALCSMAQATRHGFRSSLAGIAGIQAGNLLFFTCVALGLGALLEKATVAFNILRVLGALYLFYVGARMIWKTFRRPERSAMSGPVATQRSNLFLQGLLIQVSNPKALLFVTALLPQFIDRSRAVLSQLIVLVITTVIVDTIVLSSYAWIAHRGARASQFSRLKQWFERACGTALLYFGSKLLLARR